VAKTDVIVPDIGDYQNVPVIEVLVKEGERVDKDATLITLESEKATMEVPAPAGGIVRGIKVKVGDKVSQNDVIMSLETEGAAVAPPPKPEPVGADSNRDPQLAPRNGDRTIRPARRPYRGAAPPLRLFVE
jgi:pyruvate/2-oxoglutarate dehydrogenase complex dihydrolipoamide acyltransferase (E2) component